MEKLIQQGYEAYMVFFSSSTVYDGGIKKIEGVSEFLKVFSDEVTGLSPKREAEFLIDLVTRIESISKALYRMSPSKLVELKKQIEDFAHLLPCPFFASLSLGLVFIVGVLYQAASSFSGVGCPSVSRRSLFILDLAVLQALSFQILDLDITQSFVLAVLPYVSPIQCFSKLLASVLRVYAFATQMISKKLDETLKCLWGILLER
ncbi:uncharacterized protein LOC129305414 [Prosopis cineraria]|uniref:uncharacterized protein LOC129305414 n=1 Tax=Prosopis cineraria TaxID=364024 RepID=UPI002410926B|nr:uncharacterized protein LOC129305414 [Prosopis cineraria]